VVECPVAECQVVECLVADYPVVDCLAADYLAADYPVVDFLVVGCLAAAGCPAVALQVAPTLSTPYSRLLQAAVASNLKTPVPHRNRASPPLTTRVLLPSPRPPLRV
jgi:hypothetical protein